MRKNKLILAILALTLLTCAFTGCKGGCKKKKGETDNSVVAVPTTYVVSLESEQFSMIIGEERPLIATIESREGATLSFSSSDESVVKVDEYGRLTALKEGTATITVRYGEASDTCVVTVGLNGLVPLLQLPSVPVSTVNLEKGSLLDLSGSVVFNEKTYDDVELTYSVENENVGKIENGEFVALAKGTTEVTVHGTWRGISGTSMTKTFIVAVNPEFKFALNGGASEITLETQKNKVSPFEITATYDDEELEVNAEITKGSEYITYDKTANKVTSKGIAGEAEITVTYEIDGEEKINVFPIYVKQTLYRYETLVENFSAIHGDVALGTTLKARLGGTIISAYDKDGNELEVKNNKVYGVQMSDTGKAQTEITVYASTHGYTMTVEGYSGIFSKAQDFAVFNTNASYASVDGQRDFRPIDADKPMQTWTGYYILANNIDAGAQNYTHAKSGIELASRSLANEYRYGFHGTFDGQGYTIKGLKVGAFGLFGYVIDATIKNVAFEEVTLKNERQSSLLAARIISSKITDVYVSVKPGTNNREGAVLANGIEGSKFTRCIIDTESKGGFKHEKDGGLSCSGSFTHKIIEPEKGKPVNNVFGDVYVISKEKLCWDGTYQVQAENENLTAPEGITLYTFSGVKKFDTLDAMKAVNEDNDETNDNSFNKFKTYWKLVNGIPVWKSLNGEYPTPDELVIDEIKVSDAVEDFDVEWL